MNISKTVTLLVLSLFAVYCKRNDPRHTNFSSPPARYGAGITAQFEYDDHPNPFYQFGIDMYGQIPPASLSPHNILKSTYTRQDGAVLNTTCQYEYGANGYPKKMIVSFNTPQDAPGIPQNIKISF